MSECCLHCFEDNIQLDCIWKLCKSNMNTSGLAYFNHQNQTWKLNQQERSITHGKKYVLICLNGISTKNKLFN